MPNYYYVINTGTLAASANTPYSTQQIGAFPSNANCYASIADALNQTKTIDPADGDFILVSDTHSHNYSAEAEMIGQTTSDGAGIYILSVDNTACQTYKRGATETSTSTAIRLRGLATWMGIDWESGDDLRIEGNEPANFIDCTSKVTGSADKAITFLGDGLYNFIDCTFDWAYSDTNGQCNISEGTYRFHNCTFTSTSTYTGIVFAVSTWLQHWELELIGCDFSGAAFSSLFSHGSNPGSFGSSYRVHNCKFHASTNYWTGTPQTTSHRTLVTNSASTSTAAEYQYRFEDGRGVVEEETGIYRNGSTAFPGGQKISLKVLPDANISSAVPLIFDMPTRFSELSSTSSDSIRIYITSSTTLTRGDVWADVIYFDRTNKHTSNRVESVTNAFAPADFRTATALDTNTEAWTGGLTYKYHLDLDTSTNAGSDCVPVIRVCVATTATIYFCPTVELS